MVWIAAAWPYRTSIRCELKSSWVPYTQPTQSSELHVCCEWNKSLLIAKDEEFLKKVPRAAGSWFPSKECKYLGGCCNLQVPSLGNCLHRHLRLSAKDGWVVPALGTPGNPVVLANVKLGNLGT